MRVAIDSDGSNDSETADESTPLLACRPPEIALVCLLLTSTSHSAPTVFSSSAPTVHIHCSSHSPCHFQSSGDDDDEPVRCACHVRQPNKTSTKARNKLIVACILALLFMIGEVVGKFNEGRRVGL